MSRPRASRVPSPRHPLTHIFGRLNALSKEKEITLEPKSHSQAGIFKSYDKINYLYLVMPVRICTKAMTMLAQDLPSHTNAASIAITLPWTRA